MKKFLNLTLILLGGLLIMTACTKPEEKIPSNRTKEQYELEKEFKPLFDFLAEDKKDFSKVKSYESKVIITENKVDTDYTATIENADKVLYTIKRSDGEENFQATIKDNKLTYLEPVPSETYPDEFFFLTLKPEFFKPLKITDYLRKHSETDMKTISYDLLPNNSLLEQLRKKYNLSDKAIGDITLWWRGKDFQGVTSYKVEITIFDDNRDIFISDRVKLQGE